MTIDEEVSIVGSLDVLPPRREFAPRPEATPMHRPGTPSGRLIALWAVALIVVVMIVLIAVEPMFQQREQSMLLSNYRTSIDKAANQATGLGGVEVATTAAEFGSPVGIVEINPIGLRQVVVEGASSPIMQNGPGHVPGTAAPGQPGNSVVVGRSTLFGAPFADLSRIAVGDAIGVTTTQGQIVYRVAESASVQLSSAKAGTSGGSSSSTGGASGDYSPILDSGRISIDALYGASSDDRLTLITSDSVFPFNTAEARVVIAVMDGKPFAPTPQNGRTSRQTGTSGDTSRWPMALLAAMCLGGAIVGAVLLYRRSSPRVAYLLTVPPLLVFAVVASETLSQLLPAWF
jgi:sortase A